MGTATALAPDRPASSGPGAGPAPGNRAGARGRVRAAARQLGYLRADAARVVNGRWWRAWSGWFTPSMPAVARYRLDRAGYLLLGPSWKVLHALLAPVQWLIRPWAGGCDLHYEADIGPGLLILHPSLGAVVSKYAVIGRNLILTGGNCIGGRKSLRPGEIYIGDDVNLGANAVVLGPIRIGNGAVISAASLVIRDVEPGQVVGGVPAKVLWSRPASTAANPGQQPNAGPVTAGAPPLQS